MRDCRQFYIDGTWVNPTKANDWEIINPSNEEPIATISLGSAADVDQAVAAAKRAFEAYSQTSVEERLALLRRVIEVYKAKRRLPPAWDISSKSSRCSRLSSSRNSNARRS